MGFLILNRLKDDWPYELVVSFGRLGITLSSFWDGINSEDFDDGCKTIRMGFISFGWLGSLHGI